MPSVDRDSSRESERRLTHQHSASSDHGCRALVPMWDSSDPERAPPPLPLNPGSSPTRTSRHNTSSAILSAHALLTEKARDSAYTTNTPSTDRAKVDSSPEKLLVKAATHRRMQSLQPGHVKDLSSFLENGTPSPTKSPEKSSSRPTTPYVHRDFWLEGKSPDKESNNPETPTPISKGGPDTPSLRPSLRRPPQNILGENTSPQSATMQALHNMSGHQSDSALATITNGSTAMVRSPQTFDAISNQILSLTSIATSLQREMAALSRRSKDNATDLVSLKEATNTRDEDIRKSLRELVTNINETNSRSTSMMSGGPYLIDSKPHTPNSRALKTISLPRIPSPKSFSAAMDREATVGAAQSSVDGTASIALLEKILRDMGTKEGQDLLVARLTAVADRLAHDGISTAKKLEDLVGFIEENTNESRALVARNSGGGVGTAKGSRDRNFSFGEGPRLDLGFDPRSSGPIIGRIENGASNKDYRWQGEPSRSSDAVCEDILKIIRSVKDSVAQGGGLTAEVKALVRELRGEVLGMGREIGRKLEHTSAISNSNSADKDQVARVVEEGLSDLKEHMNQITKDSRRKSLEAIASCHPVDGQEVYGAIKAALIDHYSSNPQQPNIDKDDIILAVKEAWENYKPEIEIQQFGLERDELLECLKEGIHQFSAQASSANIGGGATREEVFEAVVEGLKHFTPIAVESQANLSKEDILDAVRDCLEEFEFPAAPSVVSNVAEISKDDMVEAVKEGLCNFQFPNIGTALARGAGEELSRDDVFEAVKAGFADQQGASPDGDSISLRLQEIIESMREEFKAVSDEAKQNVAAHGRDTEQLLDAHKDGMEKLRADIEMYVDRAADLDIKSEVLGSMTNSFSVLRTEIIAALEQSSEGSAGSIRQEIDSIRESMASSMIPTNSGDRDEILSALRHGLDGLRADIERPRDSGESVLSGTGEILDALHDGMNSLRAEVEKLAAKPVEPLDLTVNYEILDTLKAGLEGVRADMDRLREEGQSAREVAPVTEGAVIAADAAPENLKRNDIENLEVLITQLSIKVEALESMPPPASQPLPGALAREDLVPVEEAIRHIQASVAEISSSGSSRSVDEDSVRKEDVEAIETLLRNTKAKIDEMDPEQSVKKEHLDIVELVLREAHDGVNDLLAQITDISRREEVGMVESLVKEVAASLEEMKESLAEEAENTDRVSKTDVEALEALCLDVKSQIDHLQSTDLAALASKDDMQSLGELVKEFKDRIETHAESNAKAFEERQAETVGVGERVSEVRTFMEEFKDAIKEKLDEGTTGVDALGQVLTELKEKLDDTSSGSKDILDMVSTEFEKSHAGVVGAKLESDERFEKTWCKFDEKFNEIMAKYDDAQQAAAAKATSDGERTAVAEEALLGTKAVAEDLKLLVDTLGSSMTESAEKMEEASKTVFDKVEETFARVEDTHADAKLEHQLTREQVSKAISAIEDVQGSVTENHPKILESIKDILMIVGQHYEHFKTAHEDSKVAYEYTKAACEESKTAVNTLQEKIDARQVSPPAEDLQKLLKDVPQAEKYDDTPVQEKLDKLSDHLQEAGKTFAQLDMLDKIHAQVMETAAEVSTFVALQTQRIADDHEDKEKVVEAATIALERRLAQKDVVEAQVVRLREEEETLRDSVLGLRADQESLARQKLRLTADVSSLETALRIRREELHVMEARAEALERRILEGVLDHSRAFLINKNSMGKAPRDAMNLKRVPSQATSATGSMISGLSRRSGASNITAQSAMNMAMGGKRNALTATMNGLNGASRRILSLNEITSNVPNGAFARSHSVKHTGGRDVMRKSSWAGSGTGKKSYGYGELNKENLALKESEDEHGTDYSDDEVSDAGTMKRSSIGHGTMTVTASEFTESTTDDGTGWSVTDGGEENESTNGHVVLYEDAVQTA